MRPLYGYRTRLCDLKALFSLNSSENSSCNAQNYFLKQQRARLSDGRTCPPPLPLLLALSPSAFTGAVLLFIVLLFFASSAFAFILTTLVSYGNLRHHIRIWII